MWLSRLKYYLLVCFTVLAALHGLKAQDKDSINFVRTSALIEDELSDGILWKYYHIDSLFDSEQSINILFIEKKAAVIEVGYEETILKPTSQFALQNEALAAINGSFFDIKNGGSVVFLQRDKQMIDSSRRNNHFYDEGAIALKKGKVHIIKRPTSGWEVNKKYNDILSSGPLLIHDGNKVELQDHNFNTTRHPRTALGIAKEGTLVLITVDGRNEKAAGMRIVELQSLMAWLGCTYALNLDGGGSTTFWIQGKTVNSIVNYPSDNKKFDHQGERKVANVLLILEN